MELSSLMKMFNGKARAVIFVGALTTLLTTIFTFAINNKEFTQSQFERTSNVLQTQINDLREENRELKTRLDRETSERIKLQIQLNALVSTQFNRPFAEWVKLDGIVIFVNKKYEDTFLKPRGYTIDDYLLNSDYNVWPEEVAREFEDHDNEVMESGKVWVGIEKVPNARGALIDWIIYKYPYEIGFGSDKQIGVAGTAIPSNIGE
jgi:hypothetical protein